MYWFGFPKLWAKTLAGIWAACFFVLGMVVLWHVTGEYVFLVVVVVGSVVQWYYIYGLLKRVRFKQELRDHNRVICPGCGYPVFGVQLDLGEEITCPECGGTSTGQEMLDSWMKVPEFKHAYKRHYH